jgi:hypothetical protein
LTVVAVFPPPARKSYRGALGTRCFRIVGCGGVAYKNKGNDGRAIADYTEAVKALIEHEVHKTKEAG